MDQSKTKPLPVKINFPRSWTLRIARFSNQDLLQLFLLRVLCPLTSYIVPTPPPRTQELGPKMDDSRVSLTTSTEGTPSSVPGGPRGVPPKDLFLDT